VRIVVASDHAGFPLKQEIARRLTEAGHEVTDLGATSEERTDYPPFAAAAARAVVAGEGEVGVLCCGSGIGVAISANKVPGARAATARTEWDGEFARRHNHANLLCLGGRVTAADYAWVIVEAFLAASEEGGRHAERVAQITALEAGAVDAIG